MWIEFHRQVLEATMPRVKIPKKRGPSQGIIQQCEPQERISWAPTFEERTQDETLQQERCAPRDAWELAMDVHRSRRTPKIRSTLFLPKLGQCGQFVIDSGASMHMLSKKDLSSGELETLKRSGNHQQWWQPMERSRRTNEEAQVYVHDLHIFVSVQLLEDSPAENLWVAQWYWATSDQKLESNLLQNWELRPIGSSRTIIEFYHNFFLVIASAGSICFIGTSKYAK